MNARLNAPTFELHPLCVLFPRMAGGEFDALREDIRANGLRMPITLYEDKVLDGGNRYMACLEAGVEPQFVQYGGTNPAGYAWSMNGPRRHLTPGQSAAIVATLQDWSQAHTLGSNQHTAGSATLHSLASAATRAAESGASLRTQKMADKVAKADPALAVRVGHGEVSLPKAHAAVSKPAKPKAPKPAPTAKAGHADEYDDMVEDDEPSPAAAAPADPRDAQIKSLEAQVAEYKEALNAELAENTRIGNVLDADDKVAAAMASGVLLVAENKQLRAEVASLRERVNGLMGEKNAAIRAAESWKRKAGKGGTA